MSEMPSRMAQGSQSDKEEWGTRAGHYGRRVPVSHARIFPSLVRALGWRVLDPASGSSTQGSLASYDHATRSWRTSELYLFEDLTQFWDRLPKSGTMRNGKIYAPPMSERPTEGNESGLLPTLTKSNAHHASYPSKKSGAMMYIKVRDGGHEIKLIYLLVMAGLDAKQSIAISETFMGYPISWTDCNASEIRLSLKSRN